MPVVPFTPQAPARDDPVEFTPAHEPWALMAAAQMDADGRLMHPNIDDRRSQGMKETDNRQVEDQQLPHNGYGAYENDTFGKLNREAGTKELDQAEQDNIVKAVERAMAARSSR